MGGVEFNKLSGSVTPSASVYNLVSNVMFYCSVAQEVCLSLDEMRSVIFASVRAKVVNDFNPARGFSNYFSP